MEQGFIHLYTGNGKGKTTAAFGLAVRALCAGKNVFVGQFVKSMCYNETKIETLFNGTNSLWGHIRIEQFGRGCFIDKDPEAIDVEMAREGLTIALYFGLLSCEDVIDALNNRAPQIEVVITGRYAPQCLIDKADLVTEMQEVKHYYTQGVLSRDGIDR